MNDERHIEIVPTCVPESLGDLDQKIQQVSRFSLSIHVDINDGIFAQPLTWPYVGQGTLGDLNRGLDIPVDNFVMQVHLMVSDCREIGEFFARAGVHTIVVHVESLGDDTASIRAMFDLWRDAGVNEIGVAILLGTPMEKLEPALPCSDFALFLSVATIGAQGAPFDLRVMDRVTDLHNRLPDFPIAVDGGVSAVTIASLVRAGASRFSVGSAIMRALDPAQEYTRIKDVAESALQ